MVVLVIIFVCGAWCEGVYVVGLLILLCGWQGGWLRLFVRCV